MPKSPEQREGQKEQMEVSLEKKDIKMLEDALSTKILIISEEFSRLIDKFESAGGSFEDAIERTTNGAKKGRRGNDEISDLAMDSYNENQVYDNLVFLLFGGKQRKGDDVLDNITIRKLMSQNERFNKWINAIIEGVRKHDDDKQERRNQQAESLEKNILEE